MSFDLEALFISTTNILVAPTLYPDSAASWAQWRHKAHVVYDELSRSGNLIAQAEQSELERLGQMLDNIDAGSPRNASAPPPNYTESSVAHSVPPPSDLHPPLAMPPTPLPGGSVFDENYFGTELSAAQIMDMVNSIDSGHTQWMSQAMVEHGI